MKYIDWLIQWLENYVRPSVKVRTYERYRLIIEQHIKDKIGGIELNEDNLSNSLSGYFCLSSCSSARTKALSFFKYSISIFSR